MPDNQPLPGNLPDLPAGTPIGEPLPKLPGGAIPLDALPKEGLPPLPGGAIPSEGLPELPKDGSPPMPGGNIRFKEMPKMNAGPYIKRALKLLQGHLGIVGVSFVLSLVMCLLPFVAAAAMGPIFKLFGQAAQGGDWSRVWSMTSSFYDTSTDAAGP